MPGTLMIRNIVAALVLVLGTLTAAAQEWPAKPVRIVVPFGAGATPDLVARLLADYLHDKLQQTFIVENKPGVSIGGPLAINPRLFGNLPYDPRKDLELITLLTTQPSALAVNASLGVTTPRELIELLKRNPGKYAFGSIGTGSLSQLAMEAIALKSGTTIVHIPYSSSPQAITALIRNDVQIVCLPAISVVPQLGSGALKIIAISTAERSALLPGVPTLKEAGVDGEADAWNGLIAPAGTAPEIIERAGMLAGEALNSRAIREKLTAQLMEPITGTPAQFRARIDADMARWTPVIEAATIKID